MKNKYILKILLLLFCINCSNSINKSDNLIFTSGKRNIANKEKNNNIIINKKFNNKVVVKREDKKAVPYLENLLFPESLRKREQEFIICYYDATKFVYNTLIYNNNFDKEYLVSLDFSSTKKHSIDLNYYDLDYLFANCINLTSVKNLECLNTTGVRSMKYLFANCKKLKYLNISGLQVNNIIDISYMFYNCYELERAILPTFNKNNVINISGLFMNCNKLSNKEYLLEKININNKTIDIPNDPILKDYPSNVPTEKITSMNWKVNVEIKLQNPENVEKEKTYCYDVNKIIYDTLLFNNGFDKEQIISLDFSNIDKYSINPNGNIDYMFNGCINLKSIKNIACLNTNNVHSMKCLFAYCKNLKFLDLSNFNTSNVTNMYRLFDHCFSLTYLDLSQLNMNKVSCMDHMFDSCFDLETLILPEKNLANIMNMNSMFRNCKKLSTIKNIKSLLTNAKNNKIDINYMFTNCLYISEELSNIIQKLVETNKNEQKVFGINTMFVTDNNRLICQKIG